MTSFEMGVAWAAGLLGVGLVGVLAYEHGKSSGGGGSSPPWQTPVWSAVAANSDGSLTIPASTMFGLSVLSTAMSATAATDLQAAATAGTVTPTVGSFPMTAGTAPPAGWPTADQAGTVATRWLGATTASGPLQISAVDAQGMSAWIVTGFASA